MVEFRPAALQAWQRTNVVAAANCLRELIARDPEDGKLRAAYDGLLDLLDPSRMLVRRQREQAAAAREAASAVKRERRQRERRARSDRRVIDLGSPTGVERRSGLDRRSGQDRRNR